MLAWLAARTWLFSFGFLILVAAVMDALNVTNGWVTLGGLAFGLCLGWFVGGIVTGLVYELQVDEEVEYPPTRHENSVDEQELYEI